MIMQKQAIGFEWGSVASDTNSQREIKELWTNTLSSNRELNLRFVMNCTLIICYCFTSFLCDFGVAWFLSRLFLFVEVCHWGYCILLFTFFKGDSHYALPNLQFLDSGWLWHLVLSALQSLLERCWSLTHTMVVYELFEDKWAVYGRILHVIRCHATV